MNSPFAYSRQMQVILAGVAFTYNFGMMYFVAKLILRVYGEKANVKQKVWFAFLTGTVMQSGVAYVVYFIGGKVNLSQLVYLLVTYPNPIMALVYCFLGIKILRLSPLRSIELMGNVYLYYTIVNNLGKLIGFSLFVQNGERFNYLLDASMHIFNFGIFLVTFWTTWKLLDYKPLLTFNKENTFARPKWDMFMFILKACIIFLCAVFIPSLVPNMFVANALVFVILVLFFVGTVLYSLYLRAKSDIRNKEAHIHSLMKTADEFRAIKHDFYNILQTYNGYFALGDIEACKRFHNSLVGVTTHAGELLDLSGSAAENPALVSLLMDKHQRAEKLGVHMIINLKCTLADIPISEIDVCRMMACLLDNAIEAASESGARRVSFAIEQKEGSRLIIITNSTPQPLETSQMFQPGVTSKPGHQGIGLTSVRKMIDRYANCSFQMSYYNHEMTAYVEMKQERVDKGMEGTQASLKM